jgi:prepilin peptidase CpaA
MNPFLITLLAVSIGISLIEDLQHQKIPNVVTYPTMALAMVYYSLSSGFDGFSFSAGGLALGIAFFIVPYLLGGMGAGDVKLMGATGAVLGPRGICIASILIILSGGVYGMILFAMHPRYTASFLRRMWATIRTFVLTRQLIFIPWGKDEKQPVVRYAIPIALGALVYAFVTITGYDPFREMLVNKF